MEQTFKINFPQNFRDFYTYLHKLLSRDCQILLFKNVYSAKSFSKRTGNFLNSKLVIFRMHFAKSIVFHYKYTISLFTTYQLQSSRKNKTWIFERVYLAGLFIFINLWKCILAKLRNFCVLVKLYFPKLKQSYFTCSWKRRMDFDKRLEHEK